MSDPNWGLLKKKHRLNERARMMQTIRAFFVAQEFLEVDTPYRIPCNAPEAHIDPVTSGEQVLHTSPELCMKRLLAAGYERIFQLCHCWRAEERGQRHLNEFTMLEWYRAESDYTDLMNDCEQLLRALCPQETLSYQGASITLQDPFERLTLSAAFDRYAPMSLTEAIDNTCFDKIYTQHIEPNLGRHQPTFITHYPADMAALARLCPEDPDHAERFELYIAGMELANAFSELNDPAEQRQRFVAEQALREQMGKAPSPLPEPFLQELEHLPPSAGIALGIDRLAMLLTDSTTIDEVVAFTPEML
ncbi:EF-P lysine aminoacylase EpmA [Desulfuromonas acetoxidans]|uniref:EF-P lysine aminoacylase EpmA n=1 Tax=Desulfuromonas acetoxidans TaxID=891 RepID=UPI00292CDDE0|nr:EF-P lysine aminoacylase EpmA [Desulfuromonas acetoxidans]